MKFSARMITRIVLVSLLSAALVLPAAGAQVEQQAGATSVTIVADDNDIPGVPLPPSPVKGTLDFAPNEEDKINDGDVYSLELEEGQSLTARLSGPSTAEFILVLYSPGTTSVNTDTVQPAAFADNQFYPRWLTDGNGEYGYKVPPGEAGTYYLEVYTEEGTGAYTLDWAVGARPQVSLGSSGVITHGKSKTLKGAVRTAGGSGLPGQRVELYAWSYGVDDYKYVKSTLTSAEGIYSFKVTPKVRTYYQTIAMVAQPGYSYAQSAQRSVKVRVRLTKPKPTTTIYKGRSFKIGGYVKPKHKSGNHTVYLYAYKGHKKADGRYDYVYKKKIRTTNTASKVYTTWTRYYTKKATLPSKGKWKLVAVAPDDGKHARSKSAPIYVRVK